MMGPKFEQFLGPEFVVEVFQSADLVALAQRLLDLSIEPSGPEVLSWLCRAAKREATLQAAYKFVAEAWQKDPGCMAPAILQTKATGIWLLDDSNQIVLKKTADACWEDVKKLFPPWKWRKSLTSLQDFFVAGLGLAATFTVQEMVVTPTTAATPVAEAAQSSELKAGKPPKRKHQDLPGLLPMRSPMALNTDATEAPREKGTKRKLEAECAAEAPSSCQKQNAGDFAMTMPPLPRLSTHEMEVNDGKEVPAGGRAWRMPSLPLLSKLLDDICNSNNGADVLHGATARQEIPVSEIWFTQSSVSSKFAHGSLKGRRIDEVIAELAEGRLKPSDLPLTAVKFNAAYWTLNNRSLYALNSASRQLGGALRASVATFEEMCPATAKFIQLKCSSLMAQTEELSAERSEMEILELEDPGQGASASEAEDQLPQYDAAEEEMLEFGGTEAAVQAPA